MFSTDNADITRAFENFKPTVSLTSERTMTVADLLAEADVIWGKVKSSGILANCKVNSTDIPPAEKSSAVLTQLSREHPQFQQAYPIVLRYMCQMAWFDLPTLKRWLENIERNPWRDEKSYLEAQVDYIMRLFKRNHRRASSAELTAQRVFLLAQLTKEHDDFKELSKRYEKIVESREERLLAERAAETTEFVRAVGSRGVAAASSTRVEFDAQPREFYDNFVDMILENSTVTETAADQWIA